MSRIKLQERLSQSGVTTPITPVVVPQPTSSNYADALAYAQAALIAQQVAMLQQQSQVLAALAHVLLDLQETLAMFAVGQRP